MYKKGSGSTADFLFVQNGKTAWIINDSTDRGNIGGIWSGRATGSPTSSRAAGNVRLRMTKWAYAPIGGDEGDISLTCKH